MKCNYENDKNACFSCPFDDCIRSDIRKDELKELAEPKIRRREKYRKTYEKSDADYKERLRRKRLGLPMPERTYKYKGNEWGYRAEYRKNMPEEQKERYREWQREYARKKRAALA